MNDLPDWLVKMHLVCCYVNDIRGWSITDRGGDDTIHVFDTIDEAISLERDRRIVIGGTMTITVPQNVDIVRKGNEIELHPRFVSPFKEEAYDHAMASEFAQYNLEKLRATAD